MIDTPAGFDPALHLKVGVNDVRGATPDKVAPERAHVASILAFVAEWPREAPLLVHCWAGISRSTATAFMTLCAIDPDTPETVHAERLRTASRHAYPNPLLVAHADALMERGGRMVDAIEAIGPGEPVWEGAPFSLSVEIGAKPAGEAG
ncbi:MAG: protein-tyrosine phosphatase family protein [Pseudomonadota bacterium]